MAWRGWSQASYLAYIVQPLLLVPLAISLAGAPWPALVKFASVGFASVVGTHVAGRALRRIVIVRRFIA